MSTEIVKTENDWVSKMIYSELSKKRKFDHTNKWYMHNPKSFLENEPHKLLWDFKIKTDHPNSPRFNNNNNNNNNKENKPNCGLICRS